jgi:two-component sensor histidine kinase
MADGALSAPPRLRLRRKHVSRPIAVYLIVLALVALVPAFVFSAVLLARNNEAQQKVVETLVTANARAIVQSVDREIVANLTTLRVLSTAPELLDGHYDEFHARVSEALAGTGAYLYVVDDKLVSFLSTRMPMSEQRRIPVGDVGTARRALETHDVVVSDVVYGKLSQQWVVNILLPIFPAGKPPMILGFNRSAVQLSSVLLANRMPAGWNVALIDARNNIISTADGTLAVGGAFPVPNASTIPSGGWREMLMNGAPDLVVAQQSQLTGWTVVAWASHDVVTRPLSDAFWSLLAGGVLLAALVILVVYWVSLRINRSVRGLESDAKRLGQGQPVEARPFPIAEIETVSNALGEASRRRQTAETEVRFLMRELAHRSKNQMTVIAAMAKQTARGADTVPEFVQNFERRIFGLARSTDLLLAHGVAGVDLRELVSSQLDPFCPVDGKRASVAGPPLRLNAQSAQIIGMAAHELATNAVKYGAFARDNGKLSVTWVADPERLVFRWHETGFKPNSDTVRRGFGTTVIENMVGRSLGAEVERTLYDDGFAWEFRIPLQGLVPGDGPETPGTGTSRRSFV